jgi:cell division protein FtsI/penicillin-binding protein 2
MAARVRTPASVFKPFTVGAALDDGVVRADDEFDCEHGARTYGDRTLRDPVALGVLSVKDIVAQSSNIGMSKIFDKLGGPALGRWFDRFHFADVPGDIPGGAAGAMSRDAARSGSGTMDGAVVAIGFGVRLSPLHLAALYGTIADDGLYNAPTLRADAVVEPERILKSDTARTLIAMLENAVMNGSGKAASIRGVRVAGKTGTADLEDADSDGRSTAFFAGIVPADAPRFTIVVVVEDPKAGASGAQAAAPAFARIARQIL